MAALILSLLGCGIYSFSGSSLPSHIKTIAVPILRNETLEYEVANEVTAAVTQRFIQDGRLKIVSEKRADCVLEARVTAYENKVHNYSAAQSPEDYIVVLRIAATLHDTAKNRDLWKEDQITVSAVYGVASGQDQLLKDEKSARQKAIADLAEDILARTMEQW